MHFGYYDTYADPAVASVEEYLTPVSRNVVADNHQINDADLVRAARLFAMAAQKYSVPPEYCMSLFHTSAPPNFSLLDYMRRLAMFMQCSSAAFATALHYAHVAILRYPTLNDSGAFYRLILTCMVVAAKFVDDTFRNNLHYAMAGGVSLEELNALEMELLITVLEWNCIISLDEFHQAIINLYSMDENFGSEPTA